MAVPVAAKLAAEAARIASKVKTTVNKQVSGGDGDDDDKGPIGWMKFVAIAVAIATIAGTMLVSGIASSTGVLLGSTAAIQQALACMDPDDSPPAGGNLDGDIPAQGNESNAKYIWQTLLADGFTPQAAAGIMGNLQQESGLDPKAVQAGGIGRGLAQWSEGGRWNTGTQNLLDFAKKKNLDPWSIEAQMGFLLLEMHKGWNGPPTYPKIHKITDVVDATIAFHDDFEGSADSADFVRQVRGKYAQEWYNRLKDTDTSGATSATPVSSNSQTVEKVLVYGDSLTVGTKDHLPKKINGATVTVNAEVGRFTSTGVQYMKKHTLPPVIFIALGFNPGNPQPDQFKKEAAAILTAAKDSTVLWGDFHQGKYQPLNQVLDNLAGDHDNLRIVHLAHSAAEHLDNAPHLTNQGYQKRAELMRTAISSAVTAETGSGSGSVSSGSLDCLCAAGEVPASAGDGGQRPAITTRTLGLIKSGVYQQNIARYAQGRYGQRTHELAHPKAIVLHYTGDPGATVDSLYNVFNQEYTTASNAQGGDNAPVPNYHFVIDQQGNITQFVPLGMMARHAIGVNNVAYGISMIEASSADNILQRPKQLKSALELTRWLMGKYGITKDNIFGHAYVNDAPFFKDLKGDRNERADWYKPQVTQFVKQLGDVPIGGSSQGCGTQGEVAPDNCPTEQELGKHPSDILGGLSPRKALELCIKSVQQAVTPGAARAIMWEFQHLGAGYSMDFRTGPEYDCSSFQSAAFLAAGVLPKNTPLAWTGILSGYAGNQKVPWTVLIDKSEAGVGDLNVGNSGATGSGGDGHVEMFLADGLTIESTPPSARIEVPMDPGRHSEIVPVRVIDPRTRGK